MPIQDIPTLGKHLKERVKGEVLCDRYSRALYSTAACIYQIVPQAIVVPRDTEDVQQVVRYAAENRLSITPRGAGSSLAGQAVGGGILLDFTKYMNRILEVDPSKGFVRVQPGVVFGTLNARLRDSGYVLPPDPSSGDYCTLGGMVANNSAGVHSVKYGSTVDYVEALHVVLADGEPCTFDALDVDTPAFRNLLRRGDTAGRLHRAIYDLVIQNADQIERHVPRVGKNASGYRLEKVLEHGRFNLSKLFVGSEGTLGIVTEVQLGIRPLPTQRGLALLFFDSLEKMGQAVVEILKLRPSALEAMDRRALDLIRAHRPDLRRYLPTSLETQLFVEFDGDDVAQIRDQIAHLGQRICTTLKLAFDMEPAFDPSDQAKLWAVRKAAVPILYNERRPEKINPFIEDLAVPPHRVPTFIRELYRIYARYDIDAALYGHAGHGNFHTRPFLDLRSERDVQRMEAVASDAFDLTIRLGGTLSGEHGDGLVRTPFLPRLYGPLYECFREVKKQFDPDNRMNPGKIVADQPAMTEHLRFGPDYRTHDEAPLLVFRDDEFTYEIEKCHGCGTCRTLPYTTSMCPMFKVRLDEAASPRAKANLMRFLITGQLSQEAGSDEAFKEIVDLCIACKMCELECPSHVNIPKLMLEAKARYAQERGLSFIHRFLCQSERLSKMGAWMAPIANLALRNPLNRWIMEKTVGLDRRRTLPPFAGRTLRRWFNKRKTSPPSAFDESVVYFSDLFANYNDPTVGIATVQVLEHNGIGVLFPRQKGSGMPQIAYGDVNGVRKVIRKNAAGLRPWVEAGHTVLASEPTATLCLKAEWPDYVDAEDVDRIARQTRDLTEFLRDLHQTGRLTTDFAPLNLRVGYHAPCHLKAQGVGTPSVDLLRLIPGLEVVEINKGCCGIAGTYGFKRGLNGFDPSMDIGRDLAEALRSSDIHLGVTECSTCRMQMEQMAEVNTVHPILLLWEAYGLSKGG